MPAPPYKRIGLGGVCSDECSTVVRNRGGVKTVKTSVPSNAPPPPKPKDDIPQKIRAEVILRDSGRCRWCGMKSSHIHHINYRSEGVDHSPHNLIVLCPHHHNVVHSNKRRWKPILLALIWLLYVERRPTTIPAVERHLARNP